MKKFRWYALALVVLSLSILAGWQSCRARKAEAAFAKMLSEKSAIIKRSEADFKAITDKWGAAIAAKDAALGVARAESEALLKRNAEVTKTAKSSIASIRNSAATWEAKFGELEGKYNLDMASFNASVVALQTENSLLLQQIDNYKGQVSDLQALHGRDVSAMTQLVAKNVKLTLQIRKARKWAVIGCGVAVVVGALVVRGK